MARRAPTACVRPRCKGLADKGNLCERCKGERDTAQAGRKLVVDRAYNRRRDVSDKFYGTAVWRRTRNAYLAEHPLCEGECEGFEVLTPAVLVDHVIPFKERPDLGLDPENLRSLCTPCHNRIGARVGLSGRRDTH